MYHYYNKKILYFVYAFMHFEFLHSMFCVQHQFMNHSYHKKMYASLTIASKLYVPSKSYSSICMLSVIGNLIRTIDSRFFASNLSSTKVSFPTTTSSYSPPLDLSPICNKHMYWRWLSYVASRYSIATMRLLPRF